MVLNETLSERYEEQATTVKYVHLLGFFRFSFHELERITEKFDNRTMSEGGRRLGEGGFGTVYKGIIDEKPVAVKKLHSVSSTYLLQNVYTVC